MPQSACLDLDYVGPKVSKELTGPWTGKYARQFDDADAFQRGVSHFAPSNLEVGEVTS